jgi:hypothetical protein
LATKFEERELATVKGGSQKTLSISRVSPIQAANAARTGAFYNVHGSNSFWIHQLQILELDFRRVLWNCCRAAFDDGSVPLSTGDGLLGRE